jgi:hypothetical protein
MFFFVVGGFPTRRKPRPPKALQGAPTIGETIGGQKPPEKIRGKLFLRASYLLCHSSSSALPFLVHHPVNQDGRNLLALAMAFDFSVGWKFSQRK